MKKTIKFLIHSNIYLSIGALSTTYMCFVILNKNIRWEPLLISSIGTFFLYNLNRLTDKKEDEVNYPERLEFIKKHGSLFFKVGTILYALSLSLSLLNGLLTFSLTLIPFILVIFYSVFRLKKFLFFKNLIVAVGWGTISYLVGAYTNIFNFQIFLLFLFIFTRGFIQSVMFDLKDVAGDGIYKIKTIPIEYSIQSTKNFLLAINTLFVIFCILLISYNLMTPAIYFLSFIAFYSYLYILAIGYVKIKILCEISDGEDILLGLFALLSTLIW